MSERDGRWYDVEAGVDEELAFHFEERVEELVTKGFTRDEARRRAREQFGDVPAVRSGLVAIDRRMVRRRRRREGLMSAWTDVRHAARRLRRSPGFLLATVLTLGLGIGAVTAVFGTVDAIAIRALPYPHSERMVRLYNELPAIEDTWALARGQFLHYRENARGFEAMGLYRLGAVTLRQPRSDGETTYGRVAMVSADLPAVLSARAAMGRLFREEESRDGGAPVVAVSASFHRNFLGGAPDVVGSTLEVDGRAYEIVGVLAADAKLPEEVANGLSFVVDVWIPLALDPAEPAQNHHVFQSVALLERGVTPDAAQANLAALVARFTETLPTAYTPRFMETGFAPRVQILRDEVIGGSASVLWILLGAVCVVLLITCANVANLFLVRADGRRREMAVRSVLGAGSADLTRHRLAETLMVTAIAGLLGIALAWAGMRLLVILAPPGIPRLPEIGMSPLTGAVGIALALGIGLLFGLLPSGSRGAEGRVLGEAGRSLTLSRGRRFARNVLVAAQVGLCFALLAGAGLLVRSFGALTAVEPGFEPDGVLTFRVVLPADFYPDAEATARFYAQLSERIEAVTGVTAVGAGTGVPLGGVQGCTGTAPVTPANPAQGGECLPVVFITPGYFEALGIPLASGSPPDWTAVRGGARLAFPSAGLARQFWGETGALDQAVRVGGGPESLVTGVVADIANDALDRPPVNTLYVPVMPSVYGNIAIRQLDFVVGTTVDDPITLVPAMRAALAELDPRVPLDRPESMTAIVGRSMSRLTFTATLLGVAAFMALVVGAVGIYGVISYTVSLRRAEIGIRVALGAHAAQVRRLVIAETMRVALVGIAAGLLITLALGSTVASLLYGVSPADPFTLVAVAVVLLLTATVAGWLPAARALRTDPLEALRAT